VVARHTWGWSRARAVPVLVLFLAFDVPFFVANLFKFVDGGYVPVLIGVTLIAAMLIWSKGRTLVFERYQERFPTVEDALPAIHARLVARVPGTAVFMSSSEKIVPPVLMHHVDRSRVLHQTVILLTVITDDVAVVPPDRRLRVSTLEAGFYRVVAHVGFMEQPAVIDLLSLAAKQAGVPFDPDDATYYLGRETIVAHAPSRLGHLAESLFALLQRNAVTADRHFGIPPRQVVEIGTQIAL
jgi:KUP system potassium uptake protein